MNAGSRRPAIRIRGIGGLIPADALTAAGRVKSISEPSAGWLIEQHNGVAKGVGEWALTVGLGEAGEGGTAIGGDRCTGDVDGAGEDAA